MGNDEKPTKRWNRLTRRQRVALMMLGGVIGVLVAVLPDLLAPEEEPFVPRSPREILLESE